MGDELYEVILNNIRENLSEILRGDLTVTKDSRNIYISIYRFGYWWNYKVYDVDLMDVNTLNSDDIVKSVIGAYRVFINDSYFVL